MKFMKYMLLNIIFFIAFSFFSCKKEPVPITVPYSPNPWEKKLELTQVWKTHLDEVTKQETYSINPILNTNGDIIMSNFSTRSNNEPIKLYDGKTGKLKWEWKDYLRNEESFFNDKHTLVNNALILSSYNNTYALDIITGQTLWKSRINDGYGSHMVFNDGEYIYKGFAANRGQYAYYIYRTKYNQLNWELICTYTDSTRKYDEIREQSINFANNAKGDKLIIYPVGCAGIVTPFAVICCYNLTTKKFEWIKEYSDRYSEFSKGRGITTYNGKLFVYTSANKTPTRWILSAINISDGSVAWEATQPYEGAELFIYKGNLISVIATALNSYPIMCYNVSTGSTIWESNIPNEVLPELNFVQGCSNVFKNYLFSTHCNILLVLNLDNGKVVCTKAAGDGCLQYGVAVNEKDRVFYVQDRTFVNCFKIPDEVK